MPLCARCCGLLLGVLIAPFCMKYIPRTLSCVFIGLLVLDGTTQQGGWRESTNWLRLSTGVGFSSSIFSLLWSVFYVA
jgi:uncharacterized membrane protein